MSVDATSGQAPRAGSMSSLGWLIAQLFALFGPGENMAAQLT